MFARSLGVLALLATSACDPGSDDRTRPETGAADDGSATHDSDAAAEAAVDAAVAPSVDASVDAGGIQIACGASEVCAGGAVCCMTFDGLSIGFACASSAETCAGGVLACDGPEDCTSGQHCCNLGESVGCADACGEGEACHAPSDCANAGDTCCLYPGIPGNGYCAATCE